MLYKKICTVGEKQGLCARPSCMVAMKVRELLGEDCWESKIFIQKVDENGEFIEEAGRATAASIIEVVMLVAPHNCRLAVYTEDPELHHVVDELATVIEEYRM